MDVKTLAYALALTLASLGVITTLLALSLRRIFLGVYAIGIWVTTLGFLALLFQSVLPEILGFFLANLLLTGFNIALALGTRLWNSPRRPMTPRLALWAGLWVAILGFDLLVTHSHTLRTLAASGVIILFTFEFIMAVKSTGRRIPLPVVNFARILGLAYIVNYLIRIALVLAGWSAGNSGVDEFVSKFTLSFNLIFSVLWVGLVLVMEAASLMEDLEEKNSLLVRLAKTDKLTGLSNRNVLDARADAEMERARRYHQNLGLIMFDLDHFKLVNDTWGHQVGDEVLKNISHTAASLIREPDSLFRWGGEEFMILVPHTSLEGAVALAEKIRQALEKLDHGQAGQVSASFGVVEWKAGETREHWFRRVDQALYRAKYGGRNRVETMACEDFLPSGAFRLEWHREWESGNQEIDQEHRQLMGLANRLLDQDCGCNWEDPARQADLPLLMDHISAHFAHEEEILRQAGYPGLDEHRQLHTSLLAEALALRSRMEREQGDLSTFFNFVVSKVIMGHMLSEDAKFHSLFVRPEARQDQ